MLACRRHDYPVPASCRKARLLACQLVTVIFGVMVFAETGRSLSSWSPPSRHADLYAGPRRDRLSADAAAQHLHARRPAQPARGTRWWYSRSAVVEISSSPRPTSRATTRSTAGVTRRRHLVNASSLSTRRPRYRRHGQHLLLRAAARGVPAPRWLLSAAADNEGDQRLVAYPRDEPTLRPAG